jgi:hypothetical protein
MRSSPNWSNLRAPQTWVAVVLIAGVVGVPSAHFWGDFAGVATVIGVAIFVLLIYLFTPNLNFYCPHCGRNPGSGDNTCQHCGKPVAA